MGESVAEATVIRWTKNPGDHVEADETVMEIATDKVDSDVPSPVSGKLLERFYKDNDVVQVGAVIAIIETAEPETVAPPAPAQQQAPATPPVVEQAPPATPVVEQPKPAPVYEAPKPAPVFEAPKPAPVAEHVPAPPPVVDAPKPAPVVEAPPASHVSQPEVQAENKQPVFEHSAPVPFTENLGTKETSEDTSKGGRFYSPLVKNIAQQENISNAELEQIPGTGAEGRLTKDDLLNYIQNKSKVEAESPQAPAAEQTAPELQPEATSGTAPIAVTVEEEPLAIAETPESVVEVPKVEPVVETPQPAPVFEEPKAEPVSQPNTSSGVKSTASMSGGDEIIEMDRMRRLIADHMVMSKHTSPHVTSFVEADVTNLVLWREKIKNSFEKREGEKITFTPLFIEAVVRSIKDMPMINIQVNGTQIIKKKDINISMATALPSGNLIVPVIKRADELNLIGLTKAVNDLANRARTGKLKPDDVQGGTFTITNVGSFGNVMGTPIINQPQVAILAVGAIRKKPAVIETLQGDMIGIRHMMFLSLSYDHRVVDGALGGSFVRRVADYLENWDPGREI